MNKFATITIRRDGSGPETFIGLVVAEGTTHLKCHIPDGQTTRHQVDQLGEWFARDSKNVSCVMHK